MVAEGAIMDMVEVVDWPELPHHMVELIMNKLMTPEISDYVRCGAVCTSWRTVFIYHHHHPPPPLRPVTLPPFLIVPTPSSSTSWYSNTKSLSFYNVIDKKVYNQFQVTIPSNRYFRGSSHGWLVSVDQNYNNCEVRLFNPFLLSPSTVPPVVSAYSSSFSASSRVTNAGEILLPSLKDISIVINKTIDESDSEDDDEQDVCVHHKSPSYYVYLRKAVLSADPLSNPIDYIVMAILGSRGRLAYCRPAGSGRSGGCHDKAWTLVEFEYSRWGFIDVIYYTGKFYALCCSGIVVVLDPTRNMIPVILKVTPPPPPLYPLSGHDTMYIVESAGCLFLVYRELKVGFELIKRDSYSTTKFMVFMLEEKTNKGKIFDIEKMNYHNYQEEQKEEEEEGGYEWKVVDDLCGSTLFLGDNHSIRVCASDYPGCKPNSIYFTDDFTNIYHCKKENGPHDLGVFNLVDGTIENHYPTNDSNPIWPVPIWIKPIVLAGINLDSTYDTSVSHEDKIWYRFGFSLLYKYITRRKNPVSIWIQLIVQVYHTISSSRSLRTRLGIIKMRINFVDFLHFLSCVACVYLLLLWNLLWWHGFI